MSDDPMHFFVNISLFSGAADDPDPKHLATIVRCPVCAAAHTFKLHGDTLAEPVPGDLTVCPACAAILEFDGERLTEPSLIYLRGRQALDPEGVSHLMGVQGHTAYRIARHKNERRDP